MFVEALFNSGKHLRLLMCKQVALVRWLVTEMGVDVDGVNSQGQTPQQVVAFEMSHNPSDERLKAMNHLLVKLGADEYGFYTSDEYQAAIRTSAGLCA